jgi:hypothetical protein
MIQCAIIEESNPSVNWKEMMGPWSVVRYPLLNGAPHAFASAWIAASTVKVDHFGFGIIVAVCNAIAGR